MQTLVLGIGGSSDKHLKLLKKLWHWAMGRGWKNSEEHGRESLDGLEQIVGRNTNVNISLFTGWPGSAAKVDRQVSAT